MSDTMMQGHGGEVVDTSKLSRYSDAEMPTLLRISNALRWFVDKVGKIGAWFAVPLVIITVIDVVARKLTWRTDANEVVGLQPLLMKISPVFGSTLLQELEWHSHTALFALVLGYGYIYNTHVRVDLVRENLSFRRKAWLEFLGVTFFLLPYCAVVIYFAWAYAYELVCLARDLGLNGGLVASLDHQELPGFRSHRRSACGHCRLAADDRRVARRSEQAVRSHDDRLARGSRSLHRGQEAPGSR